MLKRERDVRDERVYACIDGVGCASVAADPDGAGDAAKTAAESALDEAECDAASIERIASRACGMGHEGHAAAKYWSSFAKLIPEDFAFPGRHTRHATDPVNSAINYVYGALYGEVWRAVVRAGLDPYFGILHGTDRDQGSLVFDLIEEYRAPFGDRLILSMVGRGFAIELDGDGCLRTAARHKLMAAFYKMWNRSMSWRGKTRLPSEILQAQVQSLKNAFLGREEYRPFRFRW